MFTLGKVKLTAAVRNTIASSLDTVGKAATEQAKLATRMEAAEGQAASGYERIHNAVHKLCPRYPEINFQAIKSDKSLLAFAAESKIPVNTIRKVYLFKQAVTEEAESRSIDPHKAWQNVKRMHPAEVKAREVKKAEKEKAKKQADKLAQDPKHVLASMFAGLQALYVKGRGDVTSKEILALSDEIGSILLEHGFKLEEAGK